MKKGTTASTNLKTETPPLNKVRAGIDQAAFQVRDCVEVAEDISAGIPGWHYHGGIGYITKVEGTVINTIVSVNYDSTEKSTGTESGIPLSRVKAVVLPFQDMKIQTEFADSARQSRSASRRGLIIMTFLWPMITFKCVLQLALDDRLQHFSKTHVLLESDSGFP